MSRVEGIAVLRRLSPSCRCLILHLDHVSSPRSSNPACGFPALGSRSRSCSRPREAAPAAFRRSCRNRAAGVRQAHVFPDSASSFRPSHQRGRHVARARASQPPQRDGLGLASLPHATPSGVSEPKSGLIGSRQSPSFLPPSLRPSRTKAPSLRRHYAGSRWARAHHRQGFPCCIRPPARACRRHYPGGGDRCFVPPSALAYPVAGSLPRNVGGSASALSVSRPARRSLALRPARSLNRPTAALLHRSASVHVVTSVDRSDYYWLLCAAQHNSHYVELVVMLSWTGKPLPRNAFGGFYST